MNPVKGFGQECIMHLTFESINRGKTSIGQYCENNGVDNWSEYLHFSSYRKAANVRGKPVQEIIYPHSKLMIVDDQHVIIGSSNINDRSMMGDRDSEVAIYAYDESEEFGKSLRLKIWSVALGLETDDSILEECPSSDAMFNHWKTVANENFEIFDDIFAILPNEIVDAMPAYEGSFFGEEASEAYLQWKERYDERQIQNADFPSEGLDKIEAINGTLVKHPLGFLKKEKKIRNFGDLLTNPSLAFTKEGMAQYFCDDLWE